MKWINHTLLAVLLSLGYVQHTTAQCRVEYFWDDDPGVGKGLSLAADVANGTRISDALTVEGLSVGVHRLGVRAVNRVEGEVTLPSATYYRQFLVLPPEEAIQRVEYYWDTDPGIGKATAFDFSAGSTIDISKTLTTESLPTGIHQLFLRSMSDNHVSATYCRPVYVLPQAYAVEAIEYYFDTDPGIGKGTRIEVATENGSLTMNLDLPVEELEEGIHRVGLRTLTGGTWSETKVRQFLIRHTPENYVTAVEYFFGDDPGVGKAHELKMTPGKEVTINTSLDLAEVEPGNLMLGLRARTGADYWSPTHFESGIEWEGWDALQEWINSLIDTEDSFLASQYSRQFKNTEWQALYVPFTWKYQDWHQDFDVARINAFYQYDDDEDGEIDRQVLEIIQVKEKNGDLRPNYPYLIRAKSRDSYSINVPEGSIVDEQINSITCSTVETRYTFTGTYTPMTGLHSAGYYVMKGGQLVLPASDDEVLYPYRWYLSLENLGNQLMPKTMMVQLRPSDDATDIDEVSAGHAADDAIYDMAGRRIRSNSQTSPLPAGIYISNGRKHIVK